MRDNLATGEESLALTRNLLYVLAELLVIHALGDQGLLSSRSYFLVRNKCLVGRSLITYRVKQHARLSLVLQVSFAVGETR